MIDWTPGLPTDYHKRSRMSKDNHAKLGPGVPVPPYRVEPGLPMIVDPMEGWFNCTPEQLVRYFISLFLFLPKNSLINQPAVQCLSCSLTKAECHFRGWNTPCYQCGNGHKANCSYKRKDNADITRLNRDREIAAKYGKAAPSGTSFPSYFYYFLLTFPSAEIITLHEELVDDSATAAHLYHALIQTLGRRVVHLQRFDSVLRRTFDSEGDRPLVGSVFPNKDTLHAMLDRLSTIASTEEVPEKWVLPGIKLLEGEISGESTMFQPLVETSASVVEETLATEDEKVEEDAQLGATHTTPPPSPLGPGSPSHADE